MIGCVFGDAGCGSCACEGEEFCCCLGGSVKGPKLGFVEVVNESGESNCQCSLKLRRIELNGSLGPHSRTHLHFAVGAYGYCFDPTATFIDACWSLTFNHAS